MPDPNPIDREYGVPFPGAVVDPSKWTQTALKAMPDGHLNWAELFGRTAPVVLDVGCGNGRYLIGSALARPDHDHLGADILPVVIRYARKRGNQRGLPNLKFAVLGGRELLADHIAPHSVAEVHCYHPQPHYDPAKVHLRLITPSFLASVHRARPRRAVRHPDGQPRLLEVHSGSGAGLPRLPRTAGPVAGRAEGTHAARDHRHPEEAAGVPRRRGCEAGVE